MGGSPIMKFKFHHKHNLNKINNVEDLKGIIIGLRQCMKRLNVVLGEDNNIEELEKYIDNVINNYENIS